MKMNLLFRNNIRKNSNSMVCHMLSKLKGNEDQLLKENDTKLQSYFGCIQFFWSVLFSAWFGLLKPFQNYVTRNFPTSLEALDQKHIKKTYPHMLWIDKMAKIVYTWKLGKTCCEILFKMFFLKNSREYVTIFTTHSRPWNSSEILGRSRVK